MTNNLNLSLGQLKNLLIFTAVIEVGAGIVLVFCPSATISLLLTSTLDTSASIALARVAGAALFALGIAAWFAHYDQYSLAARGFAGAMILYNLSVFIVLVAAGMTPQPVGVAFWPAVIVHAAMSIWCTTCVLVKPAAH